MSGLQWLTCHRAGCSTALSFNGRGRGMDTESAYYEAILRDPDEVERLQ
jgi:hypothetical protein